MMALVHFWPHGSPVLIKPGSGPVALYSASSVVRFSLSTFLSELVNIGVLHLFS
jgi:hypothetical protein